MEYSSFITSVEKFEALDAFTKLEGEFNFLKPQFYFQPYADLEGKQPGTVEIGLRLITNFYNREDLCVEFITESRCDLNYHDPSNEDALFLEISEKAIMDHSELFSIEMEKIGFIHSKFTSVSEAQKTKIFQALIEHFREQF
ncbi:MAG TPA: hypothetical protein VFF27_05060 [Bacteroidia bacterium]|jgi:hypothetical protein|nr:hypothetical protein [Bacteroidia bacterium]